MVAFMVSAALCVWMGLQGGRVGGARVRHYAHCWASVALAKHGVVQDRKQPSPFGDWRLLLT